MFLKDPFRPSPHTLTPSVIPIHALCLTHLFKSLFGFNKWDSSSLHSTFNALFQMSAILGNNFNGPGWLSLLNGSFVNYFNFSHQMNACWCLQKVLQKKYRNLFFSFNMYTQSYTHTTNRQAEYNRTSRTSDGTEHQDQKICGETPNRRVERRTYRTWMDGITNALGLE